MAQYIYVDKREHVSKVDGAAYITVYKLDRELNEQEVAELAIAEKIPDFPGMRLPKTLKVSEYEAYHKKHAGRGDIICELPKH